MSFTISDLPAPELRSVDDWVTFYLRCENALMMGQRVRFGGAGESHEVELPNMDQVRQQLAYWRRQQNNLKQRAAGSRGCGSGSCYMPRLT